MQKPLSALFDRWAGQPILVVGGGPSVNTDLPALIKAGIRPGCVISANEHGAKQNFFPVDLVVNCDKTHLMRKLPMEQVLREALPGVPVVNRHSWADYRLLDWTFCGNSGLTSVAVACALGGSPVIVTGIDMWNGGRLYFHSKTTPVPRKQRHLTNGLTKHHATMLEPLKQFARGANVRPMSGPLTIAFRQFSAAEQLPAPKPVAYRETLRNAAMTTMVITQPFVMSSGDYVRAGTHLVVTPREVQKLPRMNRCARPLAI